MATPLDMGLALSRAGFDMMQGWVALGETLSASQRVAERRGAMMGDAARSPLAGDYAEFGRMLPEKLSAFTGAAENWFADCFEVQRQMIAQFADASSFMAGGGANPMAFMARGAERSNRVAITAMSAGGKALAPVHRAATRNAKRLKV